MLHCSLMIFRVFPPVKELLAFLSVWCACPCPLPMLLWDGSPLNNYDSKLLIFLVSCVYCGLHQLIQAFGCWWLCNWEFRGAKRMGTRPCSLPLPDGTDQSPWCLREHSRHHVAVLRCINDTNIQQSVEWYWATCDWCYKHPKTYAWLVCCCNSGWFFCLASNHRAIW